MGAAKSEPDCEKNVELSNSPKVFFSQRKNDKNWSYPKHKAVDFLGTKN